MNRLDRQSRNRNRRRAGNRPRDRDRGSPTKAPRSRWRISSFDSAESAAAEIRSGGANAIAVALDVTKLDDAIAAADRVERELGPIDILVNNAGWDVLMPFVETTPDFWDKVIAINYRGMLNCCKAVAPRMQSRGARQNHLDLLRRRPRRLDRRGSLRGMQGRDHRLLENARARARRKSHQRQRRMPGPDRHRAAEDRDGGARESARVDGARNPVSPPRTARGPGGRGRLLRQLRLGLRHRPGAERERRPDDGG